VPYERPPVIVSRRSFDNTVRKSTSPEAVACGYDKVTRHSLMETCCSLGRSHHSCYHLTKYPINVTTAEDLTPRFREISLSLTSTSSRHDGQSSRRWSIGIQSQVAVNWGLFRPHY